MAEELLKIRPDIPVILCSGDSNKVSKEELKRIGIREFCMKPIDINQLAAITRNALDDNSPGVE